MQINLSAELEQYLQAKVGSGVYRDASEVVGDVIRRMREEDERLAALRAAVRVGEAPAWITRHDRVVGVMVSPEDYEAIRAFYADRLRRTFRESAEGAAAAGLTDAKLAELLADES